jgi:hypothetical protein
MELHNRFPTLRKVEEFPQWSKRLLMAAAEQGLKSILLGTETLADQGTAAERNVYPRRVEQALGIVYRCLGDYDYLIEAFAEADYQESNARDAWAALLEKVREMDAGGWIILKSVMVV